MDLRFSRRNLLGHTQPVYFVRANSEDCRQAIILHGDVRYSFAGKKVQAATTQNVKNNIWSTQLHYSTLWQNRWFDYSYSTAQRNRWVFASQWSPAVLVVYSSSLWSVAAFSSAAGPASAFFTSATHTMCTHVFACNWHWQNVQYSEPKRDWSEIYSILLVADDWRKRD